MQDENGQRDSDGGSPEETRPQQAGEGGTTRPGMEDSDDSEAPATGGPSADEAAQRSR